MVQSMAFDGLTAGKTCVGNLAEGFPGIYIGNMDFHSRQGNGFQGIQNGNGGMGIGRRIDDDSVDLAIGPLDLVYKGSFVVGLKLFDFQIQFFRSFLQKGKKIRKTVSSIDSRFPDAKHIEIRSVDHQNSFHSISSSNARI